MSAEADLLVNKTGEMLNPVQDGLNVQLNSWSPGSGFVVFDNRKLPAPGGISYSFLGLTPTALSILGVVEAALPDGGRAAAGRSEAHSRSRPAACDWGPVGECRLSLQAPLSYPQILLQSPFSKGECSVASDLCRCIGGARRIQALHPHGRAQ